MTVSLNTDVRARLDAHLDTVERALIAAGSSREHRRGVMDDLEAQIRDMLASPSETPALADIEAVLANLDSPEAYGASRNERPNPDSTGRPSAPEPAVIQPLPISPTISSPQTSSTRPIKRISFMRHSVLVALIICGTLLLITPAVADHFKDVESQRASEQAMTLMASRKDMQNFTFDRARPMENIAEFGFWFTGTLAIVAGVFGGFIAYWRESRR